jgi:PhnB protein
MRMTPYLNFNGTCREALAFYAEVFGGKIESAMTYGESPMREHMEADWHDNVMHAHMTIGDVDLMAADVPPSMYQKPQGFGVSIHVTDPADAERIFAALAEGGTVTMPIQETFWAARFGMLSDRFGTPWLVNCAPAG